MKVMISPFQKLSFHRTMKLTYVHRKSTKEKSGQRKAYFILSGPMGEPSVKSSKLRSIYSPQDLYEKNHITDHVSLFTLALRKLSIKFESPWWAILE